MTQLLMPTRVDAIYVEALTSVIGPQSDVERTPWFDGTRDHNTQTANIGSALMGEAFADHQSWLEKGVHVHWALPDGLTRGSSRRSAVRCIQVDEMWFAPVPNRWIVLRAPPVDDPDGTPEKAWLIESDYVHPGAGRPDGPCTVYPRPMAPKHERPWVYLGRQLSLNPKTLAVLPVEDPVSGTKSVPPPITSDTSLTNFAPALTAMAHGDPYFAAHYPSCRGVFGLHDPNPPASGEVDYRVYGFYADAEFDPIARMIEDLQSRPEDALSRVEAHRHRKGKAADTPALTELGPRDWSLALALETKSVFGRMLWHSNTWTFPDRILCHGLARIDVSKSRPVEQPREAATLSVGSTAPEAMAALLLDDVSDKERREDSLVQALAETDLQAHPLDLGQKLLEARHNEQFRAYKGHEIWVIRPREDSRSTEHQAALQLEEGLAHELARLNRLQEHYNDLRDQIDHMRQDLFADWTHYMRAAYPEYDQDPFALDPMALSDHIDRTRLAPLEDLLDAAGELFTSEQDHGDLFISDDVFHGAGGPVPFGKIVGDTNKPEQQSVSPIGQLRGLRVYHGAIITGLEILSHDSVQPIVGQQSNEAELILHDGEHITALFGEHGIWRSRHLITKLGGETSFGRRFGPLGWDNKPRDSFRLTAPSGAAIVGLRGTVNTYLSGLGLIVAPLNGLKARARPPEGSVAAAVLNQYEIVKARLKDKKANDGADLTVALAPGPRYWRPHDPVIALVDPDSADTGRYPGKPDRGRAMKGHQSYYTVFIQDWDPSDTDHAKRANSIFSAAAEDNVWNGGRAWVEPSSGEGWHPLHLEWQVELEPMQEGRDDSGTFSPEFITRHHSLPDNGADLIAGADEPLAPTFEYMSGRASLNPTIGALLMTRFSKLPETVRGGLTAPLSDPTILPLGGFHDKLLMRLHASVLPIKDPIGVPTQRKLAARVQHALGRYFPTTPLPKASFHPVRSGQLIFQRLRLIDVFGRTKEWRPSKVLTPKRMTPKDNSADRARLRVRFSQAARLDFRWLSGAHREDIESNTHPESSPVCGWIVPNELDREIDLYDRLGGLLGTVNARAEWTPAPGDPTAPRSPQDIDEPTLRSVLVWLLRTDSDPLIERFVDALDIAMHEIDPADAARHQARAMLIGRPLAIVRARLGLRVKGGLAEEQSLDALRHRMDGRQSKVTHGIEHVEVPVRMGEHGQLNDGLCGYWIESGAGFAGQLFHTPHGVKPPHPHPHIRVLSEDALDSYPVRLSLGGAPITLTMLMDPRGSVHATCGVLPVKSISIPEDLYHKQINALRAVFPTGPLVMPAKDIAVPLPKEPGFSWSWIAKSGDRWHETPHHPTVQREDVLNGFGLKGDALWDRLVELGRIRLENNAEAGILWPPADNAAPDRFEDLGLSVAEVERGLHQLAHGIERTERAPNWTGRSVARNGWLQLRPLPEANTPATPSKPEDVS